ncbi:unnamed protein product [Bemisia tabaci]|uniref:Ig-like domain-containing protein n=1 Tax=Bemisia tabaci TaxID=7038 RepID=A0A9P0APX0_BEMTA|nr:unnamed protein product [Bemisia tabaci]
MHLAYVTLTVLLVVHEIRASPGYCPSVCSCKWKSGKRTVECIDRGLITIPEGIESETQVLDMSGNNLQILPRDTFMRTNLLNLQKLFLRSCRLGQVDAHSLRGLTNLVELDLTNNLLTYVPSSTFQDTPYLRELSLAKNPIQKIDSFAFHLVPNLLKLDLSNCQIKVVSPKSFQEIVALDTLKMNDNQLTYLGPDTIGDLNKLRRIELHNNPWFCDCSLRWMKVWLNERNVPYSVPPMCDGPDRVQNKAFAELHIDDFACRPEVKYDNRYVEAVERGNATIFCRVHSTPESHITWYKDGKILFNDSYIYNLNQKFVILENGFTDKISSLIIRNIEESDAGQYFCVVENRAGNTEANFTLFVSKRLIGASALGDGRINTLSLVLIIMIVLILGIIAFLMSKIKRLPKATEIINEIKIKKDDKGEKDKESKEDDDETDEEKMSHDTISYVKAPPYTPATHPAYYDQYDPKPLNKPPPRPVSLSQSQTSEYLYPPGFWENSQNEYLKNTGRRFDDRTPIISDVLSVSGLSEDDFSYHNTLAADYPPDYGLPIIPPATNPPVPPLPDAKTLRVWQRGVPVLPPVMRRPPSAISEETYRDRERDEHGTNV